MYGHIRTPVIASDDQEPSVAGGKLGEREAVSRGAVAGPWADLTDLKFDDGYLKQDHI